MWSGSVMQIFALLVTGHAQFVVPGFEQKNIYFVCRSFKICTVLMYLAN